MPVKGCGHRDTGHQEGTLQKDPELPPIPSVPPKLEACCSQGTWTRQDPRIQFCLSKPPQGPPTAALRGHHPGPTVVTSHQQIPNSISRIPENFAFVYIFPQ